ncbi:TPA: hypothetical protein ACH9CF_001528 [Streptococcus pneumoniae]|uniref:hypothetical protein n=2 Tax=Streptococcus pneumoniae TaxID=1313 RepID=UPI0005A45F16|nr:hypothetical protein [Streptococcus pneumoniae]MBW8110483.1 hypothetical protein [Streptococcus pneumoniae]MDG9611620.1 hypothetical protein [Streptococcus pneumoniae]MDG9615623.1 hypothetical protein [Streptococcus pneumoniae]MDY6773256.1 hypothetical protein [Streptococcus pneumoniae]OBX92814.1 hypothetical protein AX278_08700 [Streptococcus pneumoniae]
MMNTLKTEQYQEARDRLDTLDTVFALSPSLTNQWENGKLCYSYLTPSGGVLAPIDIDTDKAHYRELVNEYETRTGNLVYLVIANNHLINLLYVSKAEQGISKAKKAKLWQKEFNNNIFGWINACVINPNNPTSSVHEDIFIGICQGILGRIK